VAAELNAVTHQNAGEFVSTRFASKRNVVIKESALGSTANVTSGVAWKRPIDLTQDDVIRTVYRAVVNRSVREEGTHG